MVWVITILIGIIIIVNCANSNKKPPSRKNKSERSFLDDVTKDSWIEMDWDTDDADDEDDDRV